MNNEKQLKKKKNTVRKSKKGNNNDTAYLEPLKSNSKPMLRRYMNWFNEFAMDEESLVVGRFFMQYDVPKRSFLRMLEDNPEFKPEYLDMVEKIAARREEGALKNKLNSTVFLRTQSLYDRAYNKMNEDYLRLKAELAQSAKQEDTAYVVKLIQAANSDMVPERVKRNNDQ
jgi:hypothetical protein